MSSFQSYNLEKLSEVAKKLYSSIDVRSLIIKEEENWRNIYTMITCTRRKLVDLQKEHEDVISKIGSIDDDRIKLIIHSLEINEISDLFEQLKEGCLKMGDLETSLFVKLSPDDSRLHHYSDDFSGELSEYETYGLRLTNQKELPLYQQEIGRLLSLSGFDDPRVVIRSWFNTKRYEQSDNLLLIFPVYTQIINIIVNNSYDVEFNVKIDEKFFQNTNIWVSMLSSRYDNSKLRERQGYKVENLSFNNQENFYYINKSCQFKGINDDDIIKIVISNDEYGLLVEKDMYVSHQIDGKQGILKQTFDLFSGRKFLDKNLLDPKDDRFFEKSVSWLLELIGLKIIHLDKMGEIIYEGKVEKGSADIIGYNNSSRYLYVIDCTISPPHPQKIDKLLNISKYIARKKDIQTKPYIFCAVNCPTVKADAKINGVIIIDLTDIQKIYQIFKEENNRYQLNSIFQDKFNKIEENDE